MSSTPPTLPSHENSLFNMVVPETPDASIIHRPAPPSPPLNPPSPETTAAFRSFATKFSLITTDENRTKLQHMLRQFDPITGRPIDRRAELAAAQRRLDDSQNFHNEYMRQARARVNQLKAEIQHLNQQRNANAIATVRSQQAAAATAQVSPSESSFIESIMRSGIEAGQQQQWKSQRSPVPFEDFDDKDILSSSSMASESSMELPSMFPPPPLPPTPSMRYHQQQYRFSRGRLSSIESVTTTSVQLVQHQSSRSTVARSSVRDDLSAAPGSSRSSRQTRHQQLMQLQLDTTDPPVPRTTSVVSITSNSSSERSSEPIGTNDTFQMPSVHPLYLRRKIMRNMNAPW